jgi:hypothetical protein
VTDAPVPDRVDERKRVSVMLSMNRAATLASINWASVRSRFSAGRIATSGRPIRW